MEMKIETDWIELWHGYDNFRNVPHKHEDWLQVTLPIKGTCHFSQEERNFRLNEGNGLLQLPGTKHWFSLGEQSSAVILKVRENGSGGLSSVRRGALDGPGAERVLPFRSDEIIGKFRRWMLTLMEGQTLTEQLAVQEVESEVLACLNGLLKPEEDEPSIPRWPAAIADPHLRRAIDYIRDCYTETINVDELAAIALKSRFHFIRAFREATGTTPYQYVLLLRMEDAKRRLRRTEATIARISAELGFSSASQFHRAFLKTTGMTPQAYRLH